MAFAPNFAEKRKLWPNYLQHSKFIAIFANYFCTTIKFNI